MDSKEMKDQAQYIWNRLDDLAKTDPKAYKKFIEKQMEEHKLLSSTPEPKICIQTTILGKEEEDLFVNICSWQRLPIQESDSEPMKIMCGLKKYEKLQNGKKQVVIPVSMNDQTLDKLMKNNFEKDELMQLILNLIEDQEKIKISHKYKFYKEIYKGDLPADPRTLFLHGSQIPQFTDWRKKAEQCNSKDDILKSTGDLLKHLSTDDDKNSSNDGASNKDVLDALLGGGRRGKDELKQEKLIQEINENEANSKGNQTQLNQPEYTLKEVKADVDEDSNSKYQLKIYLPLVSSVQDCSLNITEEFIELFVEDKYELKLQFEKKIAEDEAHAKFNKRTSHLTVIVPVQNS